MNEGCEWQKESIESILKKISTSKSGLSSEEAKRRLIECGPDELEEMDGVGPFRMFFQQLRIQWLSFYSLQ